MIGKLRGTIDEIDDDHVLIDVHGICYVVFCSVRTLGNIGSVGEAITLYIETYVREDQFKLFGFPNQHEKQWFILLQTVQGVGAKVALAILSTLTASDLANAIALQDKAMVARAPGIGPKVAQRIVSELKNKVPAFAVGNDSMTLKSDLGEGLASSAVTDAVSALANLGYSREQAAGAVSSAIKQVGEDADSATLIRLGLKELSQ